MSNPSLNAHEARVLGVLIEKELTTPEGYPLSVNALTSGSNQKSNRDPVVEFMEAEVHVALTGLLMKNLVGKVIASGSRVEKFRHNAREALELQPGELAVLAELLLRGAQQAGELRTRAARMAPLATQEALSGVLARLIERGLVRRVPAQAGERAERYMQLLAPASSQLEPVEPAASGKPRPLGDRAAPLAPSAPASLEHRVSELERRLGELERALGAN